MSVQENLKKKFDMEPCTSGQKTGRVLQDIEIDMRLFYEKLPTRSRSGVVMMMVWMVVERRIRNDANALTTKPFNKEGVEEFNAIHRNLCTYFIT